MTEVTERAVNILKHDGLIIYPTETVYGLGADALSDEAIIRVYEAKGRDLSKPISIAVSDKDMLYAVARVDDFSEKFIEEFMPGPVTILLEAKSCIPEILTGGTGKIGIRFPSNEIAIKIIRELDNPITATSANRAGANEPVMPDECNVPHNLIVDGGKLNGTPSTVVDLVERKIIREGIMSEEIRKFLETNK